ncbi:hypothetical protein [Sphingomonas sp. ZB1N12]|uniref:hypothetical protein n=1 Tax=Sphingomonas arabinosi TaxID=3096160 RepID=UPI002FC62772
MVGDSPAKGVVGARFDEQVQVVGAQLNAASRLQFARKAAVEISESRHVVHSVQTEVDRIP